MGYAITLVNGIPTQSWSQDTTIATDMLLSVMVQQGAFFANPNFGIKPLPKKLDDQAVAVIRQRFVEAWKWLIDTGRAKSIDVIAERDNDDRGRVNIRAQATQANNQIIPFAIWVDVA